MPGTLRTVFLRLLPDQRHTYGCICPDRDRFFLDNMALPGDVLSYGSDDLGYLRCGQQTGKANHR